LQTRPDAIAALLAPVFPGKKITALPIDGEGTLDNPCYLAFEWTGRGNYLNEAVGTAVLQRGANSTSVDAMVLLDIDGQREIVLIEWKYTESYGAPLSDKTRLQDNGTTASSNSVRLSRYDGKLFGDNGPLKCNDGFGMKDLFWEPFYQFARQQMLAFQLELHGEEGAKRVSILHLAPAENVAFQRITAPTLKCLAQKSNDYTACTYWKSLLTNADRFETRHIEELFAAFPAETFGMGEWAKYIVGRYGWRAG